MKTKISFIDRAQPNAIELQKKVSNMSSKQKENNYKKKKKSLDFEHQE